VKSIGLILAVIGIVSPAARAAGPAAATSESCFLFSYFVGNGEDGLHLARSADGYHWEALNGGKSFLAPKVGKSKLMRDPCLLRAPDGTFQLVWTDSWDSRTIGHASSSDLLHWSQQQAVGVMEHEPQAMNCWAPEVVYDEGKQQYVVFWATTIPGRFPQTDDTGDGKYNHRIYATTTKDFKTFTPTRLFFDGGFNVIDATMLRVGPKYCLIVKDETLKPVKKDLRMAVGAGPEGPFGDVSAPFTPAWVEGPTAIRVGDDYVVYFDCYRDGHYGAVRSRDLKDWEDVTSRLAFPKGARHGTVLQVPKAVVDKLSENQPKREN
jgi:beta-xylosidase